MALGGQDSLRRGNVSTIIMLLLVSLIAPKWFAKHRTSNMTDKAPTLAFQMGRLQEGELVAKGKDWFIARQGPYTQFSAIGREGEIVASRSTPYGKEMASRAIDTLRDTFAYNKDKIGLAAVAAMQAYVDGAF